MIAVSANIVKYLQQELEVIVVQKGAFLQGVKSVSQCEALLNSLIFLILPQLWWHLNPGIWKDNKSIT